jgi:hypothetical protein
MHFVSGSIEVELIRADDVETTNLPYFFLFANKRNDTFDASRIHGATVLLPMDLATADMRDLQFVGEQVIQL